MTHKRMLATNANTLCTAESLDLRGIGGAHENTCRRLSDRRGVSPATAIAQISLMLIVLLIMLLLLLSLIPNYSCYCCCFC